MANSVNMKWTNEIEKLLIELVKERPHLWNIKDKMYPLRTLKRNSYQEIADILAVRFPEYVSLFSVDDVMTKFSNLRTYYRKENKKFKQPSGSAGIGFVPRWEHFFIMQFLDEALESTESSSSLNVSVNEILINDSQENTVNDESVEANLTQDITNAESSNVSSPKKRKRKRKNSNELTEFALKTLNELNAKTEDEEELYGQYIAKVLKSFDPVARDLCKFEFSKIILKLRHNVDV